MQIIIIDYPLLPWGLRLGILLLLHLIKTVAIENSLGRRTSSFISFTFFLFFFALLKVYCFSFAYYLRTLSFSSSIPHLHGSTDTTSACSSRNWQRPLV